MKLIRLLERQIRNDHVMDTTSISSRVAGFSCLLVIFMMLAIQPAPAARPHFLIMPLDSSEGIQLKSDDRILGDYYDIAGKRFMTITKTDATGEYQAKLEDQGISIDIEFRLLGSSECTLASVSMPASSAGVRQFFGRNAGRASRKGKITFLLRIEVGEDGFAIYTMDENNAAAIRRENIRQAAVYDNLVCLNKMTTGIKKQLQDASKQLFGTMLMEIKKNRRLRHGQPESPSLLWPAIFIPTFGKCSSKNSTNKMAIHCTWHVLLIITLPRVVCMKQKFLMTICFSYPMTGRNRANN